MNENLTPRSYYSVGPLRTRLIRLPQDSLQVTGNRDRAFWVSPTPLFLQLVLIWNGFRLIIVAPFGLPPGASKIHSSASQVLLADPP